MGQICLRHLSSYKYDTAAATCSHAAIVNAYIIIGRPAVVVFHAGWYKRLSHRRAILLIIWPPNLPRIVCKRVGKFQVEA